MDLSGHEGEIPMPISTTHVAASTPNHVHYSTPPPSLLQHSSCPKKVAKYRECLKNHAASIGGNATDGCGEFMPSGEDGTIEALKCSACNCHRNFHRRENEGEEYYRSSRKKIMSQKDPFGHGPLMIMPLGHVLQHTSESDDQMEDHGGFVARASPLMAKKKRSRTKFTAEQKEKMLDFAERAGWRMQKEEESVVQQLCQEIGVKRRVLKVWMHNNKHNLANKNSLSLISHLSSSMNDEEH